MCETLGNKAIFFSNSKFSELLDLKSQDLVDVKAKFIINLVHEIQHFIIREFLPHTFTIFLSSPRNKENKDRKEKRKFTEL